MKPLNIGMIGYGLMGRAHTNAFRQVSQFFKLEHRPVLKAVCGRDGVKAAEFAANWGYESVETDWKAMIARPDIDSSTSPPPTTSTPRSPSPPPKPARSSCAKNPSA
jgi:predicted dehydrogenase